MRLVVRLQLDAIMKPAVALHRLTEVIRSSKRGYLSSKSADDPLKLVERFSHMTEGLVQVSEDGDDGVTFSAICLHVLRSSSM